jgi:hypothetical protein
VTKPQLQHTCPHCGGTGRVELKPHKVNAYGRVLLAAMRPGCDYLSTDLPAAGYSLSPGSLRVMALRRLESMELIEIDKLVTDAGQVLTCRLTRLGIELKKELGL